MDSASGGLPYAQWIGGGAAHVQSFIGETGPAAKAQRKEFKKAAERMRTGAFGFTEGQRQGAAKVGRQGIASQQAQQQADVARMQASGTLAGGAASEAQRQIAAQGQAAQGAQEANIQAASDASAQMQYNRDRGTIDAQAAKWRNLWKDQAAISQQATSGNNSFGGGTRESDGTPPISDEVVGARSTTQKRGSTTTYTSVGG